VDILLSIIKIKQKGNKMPIISPTLVPLASPGNLFELLNDPDLYPVRWIQPIEPVFYTVQNRPSSDITFRQLVIAKSIDNISLRLSHQANFPFIISPIIIRNLIESGLPLSWIWDIHVSLPKRWRKLRLAKIKRLNDGDNGTTFTGTLRLYFSSEDETSEIETYMFYIDYDIGSELTYQICETQYITDEIPCITSDEFSTLNGWVVMRTIDPTDDSTFYSILTTILTPPVAPDTYTTGSMKNSDPDAAITYDDTAISHGTGMLTSSAFNAIPSLDMVIDNWLIATNYPFRVSSDRISTGSLPITIPQALFEEFSIIAPTPDLPSTSTTVDVFPVWISRIERLDASANSIKITLSTYNIEHDDGGYRRINFATITLSRSNRQGDIVRIVPVLPLFYGKTEPIWGQKFGDGYVLLSRKWGATGTTGLSSELEDFFDDIAVGTIAYKEFNIDSTILSSYSVSRVPANIPTNSQFQALKGTKGDGDPPSMTNPYVVKNDCGKGTLVNFAELEGFGPVEGLSNTGFMAVNLSPIVRMDVTDPEKPPSFEDNVKPRLEYLLGRTLDANAFGVRFFDGVRLFFWNGDAFVDA
jgi:hypothetical protein